MARYACKCALGIINYLAEPDTNIFQVDLGVSFPDNMDGIHGALNIATGLGMVLEVSNGRLRRDSNLLCCQFRVSYHQTRIHWNPGLRATKGRTTRKTWRSTNPRWDPICLE